MKRLYVILILVFSITIISCGSSDSGPPSLSVAPDTSTTPTPTTPTLTCPTNFVKIPANTSLGTTEFCLAQYEMKVSQNDGTPVFDSYNGNVALNMSLHIPNSRSNGIPWVKITLAEAKAECESLGAGFHLSTVTEWQAAALNIESVANNWSNNTAGSGIINSGHSDGAVSSSAIADGLTVSGTALLSAGLTGTDGYIGTGQSSSLAWGSGGEQKRFHLLSNGEVIWDMAGNAREIVNVDSAGSSLSFTGPGSSNFYEVLGSELSSMITTAVPSSSSTTFNISAFRPMTNGLTHAANNIGKAYIPSGARTGRLVSRGGNFSSGNSPGLFAADFDSSATGSSSSLGFRCAK